ncbi:MAG: homoserine kinase [Anaerolineae bacterium]|nr:homoserine kinase [Anaerolineae bacterium]MBT7782033.1 homoserine kinase [Anaerolineae bacterium]
MKIKVIVPATTANLGPGFDALGLALNLWNEAEFSCTSDSHISVTVKGEGTEKLPQNADNAIAQAALMIYDLAGKSCPGLQIDCLNRVPLGSGMGSSSAAMLTGMLGANALLDNPFTDEEILKLAIETEGHPDNVAPAMLGGLVASILHKNRVVSMRLPTKANHGPIHATLVLPNFDFPTSQARAILPKEVNRSDAIYNISRVVLVTEALRTGNMELLGIAMKDSLHQPYRLKLIPGAISALEAGKEAGASAVALSGAGPSLIAFSAKEDEKVGVAMKVEFESAGLSARIFELGTSYEGAEVTII